jgi:hypothetical protein
MNPALRASINSLVYSRMQGMIEPGDLDNQGKMIFSILVRRDGYDDDPSVIIPEDGLQRPRLRRVDDYIEVEYQFDFPARVLSQSWTSKLGSKGSKVRDSDVSLGTRCASMSGPSAWRSITRSISCNRSKRL